MELRHGGSLGCYESFSHLGASQMYVDLEEDKEAQFGTCQVCGASPSFVLTQYEGRTQRHS